MDIIEERCHEELEGLQALARNNPGRLTVSASADLREFRLQVRNLRAPVGTREGSFEIVPEHEVRLYLPPQYPDRMPVLSFGKAIFHPNCWESGTYCLGSRWYPARRLSEIVVDVLQDIQLMGPQAFNLQSPANRNAQQFYRQSDKVDALRRRLTPTPIMPVTAPANSTAARAIRVVQAGEAAAPNRATIRVIRR